jgi:hypothetical protein
MHRVACIPMECVSLGTLSAFTTVAPGTHHHPHLLNSTHIVLNLSANAASLQYYVDAGGATRLPFVCEIDIAVRIAPASQSSVDSGNVRGITLQPVADCSTLHL